MFVISRHLVWWGAKIYLTGALLSMTPGAKWVLLVSKLDAYCICYYIHVMFLGKMCIRDVRCMRRLSVKSK